MIVRGVLLAVGLLVTELSQAGIECEAVVAETLAELRLGADAWTDQQEAWVRTAAASSCLKASSGRYGHSQLSDTALSDTAVPAEETFEDKGSEEDEGFSLLPDTDMKVEPMSGAPWKKPYQRVR